MPSCLPFCQRISPPHSPILHIFLFDHHFRFVFKIIVFVEDVSTHNWVDSAPHAPQLEEQDHDWCKSSFFPLILPVDVFILIASSALLPPPCAPNSWSNIFPICTYYITFLNKYTHKLYLRLDLILNLACFTQDGVLEICSYSPM